MSFQPLILWTDGLYFLLILLISIFIFLSRKNIFLQTAWLHIAKRPLPMFSLIVLLFFALIAFLDSLHFHPLLSVYNGKNIYSTGVQSLLDVMIAPLGQYTAQTYSAPFKLFATQPIQNIGTGLLFSFLKAILCFFIFVFLITLYLVSKTKQRFLKQFKKMMYYPGGIAWRSIFLAIFLIFTFTAISLYLSQYYYIFGTDKVGADVFYQAIKSIRTGLMIGTLTTLLMLPFAIFFGAIAGYFSGWIDDIVQYVYTVISSIPGVLLIVASVLSLQIFIKKHSDMFLSVAERADARLLMLCIILGATTWTDLCRLIRAETLKLREMDFVQAAKVMGVSRYKIILNHILPNLMHIVLITITLNFSMLVLAEAVLSYVGVGVDPSTTSWGNMINNARFELAREPVVWWPLMAAFGFMFILVLAANLFSDALRDALDPRVSDDAQ